MRPSLARPALLAVLALACLPAAARAADGDAAPAGPALPTLDLITVASGFTQPTDAAAAPNDPHRLFVVEKRGVIRVIKDGVALARPFLDISPLVFSDGEERGALSVAFPPDYARSGLFYVAYTALDGDVTVDEYRRTRGNPDLANPTTRRLVIAIRHPNHNHNSGQLQFGPDGLLYLGVGDGGGSGDKQNHAQNLQSRLGKILRLDPRPGEALIPPDNPFFATGAAAPEIYAYGFRNPWRFSFDRLTGGLAIADVGQNEVEEIDYAGKGRAAGRNFGWNRCEGDQAFPPVGAPRAPCSLTGSVRPSIVMHHSAGYCAAIGGYVVRDRSLGRLYGRYVYGDWCKQGLRAARLGVPAAQRDDRPLGAGPVALTAFGQDAGGCLYAVSIIGTVQRIAAEQIPGVQRPAPGDGHLACMPLATRTVTKKK